MQTKTGWWLLALAALLLALSACTSNSGGDTASVEEGDTAVQEDAEHADEEEHADDPHAGEEEHADEHADDEDHDHEEEEHDHEEEMLKLPELSPAALDGAPLTVVATTSIIGDIVARIGDDQIDLTVLMGPGEDPHSFQPVVQELTAVATADVVFVNGWDLEAGLADDLETIGEGAPIVPISANIEPLPFGGHAHEGEEHDDDEHDDDEHDDDEHGDEEHDDDEHEDEHGDEADGDDHDHGSMDPHVWFSITNVSRWVDNVAQVLSELDPDNAATYTANAVAYQQELTALEEYAAEQLATIPESARIIVTNHDSFNYFAAAYDFTILGTIIPGGSTLAEPSASDLADLITTMEETGVCTIFTETTVSDTLAQTVAAELDGCSAVDVISLYTGAVGPAGSGADSYAGMMRANIDAIVSGLE